MVAIGIDVLGEIEDLLCGGADLARADRGRQAGDDAEDKPGQARGQDRGSEDAELGLVQPAAGERQV